MNLGTLTEEEIARLVAKVKEESSSLPTIRKAKFGTLRKKEVSPASPQSLNILGDVKLELTVELGRTRMTVREVLQLKEGSVIELNKTAGEHVDVFLNDLPFAKAEVVVINEVFGIRINSLLDEETETGKNGF
ncbi:flagellar motor switch protein FliN [Calderihabitans maritimus]|uniref:Flagellar motor switch FliN n=1 Tax=Calderihabitans maritimus TaxID=1246530 RepID=A0A1Z5HU43_9FIRM|nr:flagellar motor switch protein FliN [Calderihabitans maritimus]GAW92928.1 flagellar motor switch FliN [Calderihabitans maritimus]